MIKPVPNWPATIARHTEAARGVVLGLLVVLLMGAGTAIAHRGHGAWTNVTWAEDRFEIVHRIHLADAIELLRGMAPDAVIDSIEGQARLALYVESRFTIYNADGTPVSLDTIGAEIDDDFLVVYQEWPVPTPPEVTPQFSSRVLFEIDPTAQRFVRYEVGEAVSTQQLEQP